ncbi:MAG: Hsp20/alpha crystallin family protein [Angelakisella sp.]|nr:Hsp20/alpha crystallin family protein [Angelakisella sp.]
MFDLTPFTSSGTSIGNLFDTMTRSFFGDTGVSLAGFRTDVLDKGDHYLLEAELPGFNKEDIRIDLDGDRLVIAAEHKEEKEDRQEQYLRRERSYGSFMRAFDVSSVKTDNITAKYQNGVLELTLPKKQPDAAIKNRQILIQS